MFSYKVLLVTLLLSCDYSRWSYVHSIKFYYPNIISDLKFFYQNSAIENTDFESYSTNLSVEKSVLIIDYNFSTHNKEQELFTSFSVNGLHILSSYCNYIIRGLNPNSPNISISHIDLQFSKLLKLRDVC